MPVSRGYPKGSEAVGATAGADGLAASASESEIQAAIDTSGIEAAISDVVTALVATSKDILTGLYMSSGQALVVLAGDYKAYFDLTAYSGSILKVAADATAILKTYGDLSIDNSAEFRMDNLSHITIKGD